jgi:hypothetical protein
MRTRRNTRTQKGGDQQLLTAEQILTLTGQSVGIFEDIKGVHVLRQEVRDVLDIVKATAADLKTVHTSATLDSTKYNRVYISSDIHADYKQLLKLLLRQGLIQIPGIASEAEITPETIYDPNLIANVAWIGGEKTLLVFVGDLIDGRRNIKKEDGSKIPVEVEDPKGIFEVLLHALLYNLGIQARKVQSDVLFTIGNHDLALLKYGRPLSDYVHFSAKTFYSDNNTRLNLIHYYQSLDSDTKVLFNSTLKEEMKREVHMDISEEVFDEFLTIFMDNTIIETKDIVRIINTKRQARELQNLIRPYYFTPEIYFSYISKQYGYNIAKVQLELLCPFYDCSPFLYLELANGKNKNVLMVHAGISSSALMAEASPIRNLQKALLSTSLKLLQYPESEVQTLGIAHLGSGKENDPGALWYRGHAEKDARSVCPQVRELGYDLVVEGHCPTNEKSFSHFEQIKMNKAKYGSGGECDRGCVLLGCKDEHGLNPKLAFVDVTLSESFGKRGEERAEILLLEHYEGLNEPYYNVFRIQNGNAKEMSEEISNDKKIAHSTIIPNELYNYSKRIDKSSNINPYYECLLLQYKMMYGSYNAISEQIETFNKVLTLPEISRGFCHSFFVTPALIQKNPNLSGKEIVAVTSVLNQLRRQIGGKRTRTRKTKHKRRNTRR